VIEPFKIVVEIQSNLSLISLKVFRYPSAEPTTIREVYGINSIFVIQVLKALAEESYIPF
jgi:hypothetical protein